MLVQSLFFFVVFPALFCCCCVVGGKQDYPGAVAQHIPRQRYRLHPDQDRGRRGGHRGRQEAQLQLQVTSPDGHIQHIGM